MVGELLTRWTIRAALALLVIYLAGGFLSRSPRWLPIARWIWTAGCTLFVLHVVCAFQFYHHWSASHAWQDTAQQTQDLIGVSFGDGIYFSYLFMALWILDVLYLWLVPVRSRTMPRQQAQWLEQTRWPRLLVHLFLAFIAFNGAIVFEAGPTRWWGLAATVLLVGLAVRSAYHSLRASKSIPACEIIH